MVGRILFPRLTKADVEGLMSAHQKLVALDATLKGTNWAGARACIVLVGDVDLLIARLFNKAEATMLRAGAAAAAESPQEAPAEIPAKDIPAGEELAPPGKPEGE